MREIKEFFTIVAIIIIVAFSVVTIVRGLVILIDNVTVVCRVNGEEIYSGPSYAISIMTGGATTKVTILGGYMALFPKGYYVSNDVSIIGKK